MISTMSMMRYKLNMNSVLKSQSRSAHHNKKTGVDHTNAKFDQYLAHSPLQISKHKVDELRSKIFLKYICNYCQSFEIKI